jgi:glycosyltransferase involved in cell wall biosynthesis
VLRPPAVSIIVPNYNHARFLPKRIDSILHQTYQDFELILLDDCSTDNSRSILSQYASDPRVRIEFNTANSGSPFKQWNKGARLAQGNYIWFAESDDYADHHFLERLVPFLDADPSVVFAYCRSWRVLDGDQIDGLADSYLDFMDRDRWKDDFCMDGVEACRMYFSMVNAAPNASAVVFRRSVYEAIGGADENYRLCGDWKVWAAMALTGKIAHVHQPLNYYRCHDSSVRNKTTREALDVSERFRVIRWILNQTTPEPDLLERICDKHALDWVPVIMSMRVPVARKLAILRDIRAIDPHPVRRALRPGLRTVQMKFTRHWRSFRAIFSPTV